MDYESIPFGIKLSAFFAVIVLLTYAAAAIAPHSSEPSGETPRSRSEPQPALALSASVMNESA